MTYFTKSLNGLNKINSSYINNRHDISTNNLYVSGIFSSPVTNTLGISSNILDNKIYGLGISSGILDNKIYGLGISSGNLQGKINNLSILGISGQNVDTQISVSCGNMDYINYLQAGRLLTLENLSVSFYNEI